MSGLSFIALQHAGKVKQLLCYTNCSTMRCSAILWPVLETS